MTYTVMSIETNAVVVDYSFCGKMYTIRMGNINSC